MDIKLYVEGGGKGSHKRATIKLQQGFGAFFGELKDLARERKISFVILPSGNTQSTYDEFIRSVAGAPEKLNLLLVDSDDAVPAGQTARAFLQNKYKKWKLQAVEDSRCHLMVRTMESWFVADLDALEKFYGQNFQRSAFPKNPNVEAIDKAAIENALDAVSSRTKKENYQKIEHGAKILESISAEKVRNAAPYCKKLFKVITENVK